MRTIQKRSEPQRLTQLRAAFRNDPNFGYGLIDSNLRKEIVRSLVEEQGAICAYTGRRISVNSCHIEHPKPQVHCQPGEDVEYTNMVACFPAPNAPRVLYGANHKGSWPDATQAYLFVSPLRPNCETRFVFSLRGQIGPSSMNDAAARETIKKLGLDHEVLTQLRKAAIDATLCLHGKGPASLDVSSARRRLAGLVRATNGTGRLEAFCFVLKQALEKHITRIEAIRSSIRRRR